jgi:dihydroxy-acid dehydratase
MVHEDLRMSQILTREAFENAIMVNGAIGGSTNAVVHLLAIARRVGVNVTLDDWDRLGQSMPCLVNLMPSGDFLMEDFYYAGGTPVVVKEIGRFLHKKALTVNGRRLGKRKDAGTGTRCVTRSQAVQEARRHSGTARQSAGAR